jgi:alkylation response protein AidB-like acyl-CoA dehydrogenase
MEFQLTSDQSLLQDALRNLFAGEYDFESRKRSLATAHGFHAAFWQDLATQGVLAVGLPAEHGGFGGGAERAIVMELVGRHLVLEPVMSTVVLGGGLIGEFAAEARRAPLLAAIAAGECRVAMASADGGDCIAERRAGAWSLTGESAPVLDGAIADWLIVPARETAGGEVAVFLVEAGSKGVERLNYRTHDGRSAGSFCLRDVVVSPDAVLGEPGRGAVVLGRAGELAIPALCAEAVGIMDALIETTLGYLQNRTQFGQPIGRFQALQHRLADMFVKATQARSMSLLATERAGHADERVRRRSLSAAKAYVDKAGRFIGQNAVQLHGGMGMTAELAVSHYFKRLTLIGTAHGDRDHHLGVVSDALLAESA